MKEKLEKKLAELKKNQELNEKNYASLQKQLEQGKAIINANLGAIQTLEELLKPEGEKK